MNSSELFSNLFSFNFFCDHFIIRSQELKKKEKRKEKTKQNKEKNNLREVTSSGIVFIKTFGGTESVKHKKKSANRKKK